MKILQMFETRENENPVTMAGKHATGVANGPKRGPYVVPRSHSVYVCSLTLKSETSLPLALGDLILGTRLWQTLVGRLSWWEIELETRRDCQNLAVCVFR